MSPEQLKIKRIKETIDKSKRASSTMKSNYDAFPLSLPSLFLSQNEDLTELA
jgi:hypothetical protein